MSKTLWEPFTTWMRRASTRKKTYGKVSRPSTARSCATAREPVTSSPCSRRSAVCTPLIALMGVLGCGLLGLAACQRAAPAADAKAPTTEAPAAEEPTAGVTLNAEQVAKAGIVTTPVQAADYVAETSGYGVVVAHDTLAVAVAELTTAQAAAAQSRAAAARAQRLAGTPGALSADTVESATRQGATDTAALALAPHRKRLGTPGPGER
jgi:hypothetical protein